MRRPRSSWKTLIQKDLWGPGGIGEMAMLAIGPAIVAAVHDATGVWFDQLPLTPERIVWGLASVQGGQGVEERG